MSGVRSRGPQIVVTALLLLVGTSAFYALTQLPPGGVTQEDLRAGLGSVVMAGEDRPYLFHVPAGLDDSGGVPLVLLLHGAGTGAQAMRTGTGFNAIADAEGAIAVYPNAAYPEGMTSHAWNAGFCCDAAQATQVDDLGYLVAIIDQFSRAYNIDQARIFVIGASSGAMMAHSLAAHHADRIAAIATVSGAVGAAPAGGGPMELIPAPASRVSVLMLHGDHDRIVPFDGGASSHASGEVFPSFLEGVELWARYNGLEDADVYEDPGKGVAWRAYRNGSVAVVGGAIEDAGHSISSSLSTGEWLWEFLKAHPKPAADMAG